MPAGLCGDRADGRVNAGRCRAQTAPSLGGTPKDNKGSQGTQLFPVLPGAPLLAAGPAMLRGLLGASEGQQGPLPCQAHPSCPYPLADEQAVGVLDGGSLVQQQGLELAFLNVVEGVKHHSQKL